jgi:hypothetical protein
LPEDHRHSQQMEYDEFVLLVADQEPQNFKPVWLESLRDTNLFAEKCIVEDDIDVWNGKLKRIEFLLSLAPEDADDVSLIDIPSTVLTRVLVSNNPDERLLHWLVPGCHQLTESSNRSIDSRMLSLSEDETFTLHQFEVNLFNFFYFYFCSCCCADIFFSCRFPCPELQSSPMDWIQKCVS